MKDIYELLNEANIDLEEIEEMEVSEFERKRGKKKLMASIKNTPKGGQSQKRRSKKVAIAASLVVVMGASTIFVSKPAWASNIPIIGDLIQNNLIDVNSKYIDYIQAVGQTKSDKGIDITFESAIADRNLLNLSFIVKNNNESIEDNYTDALVIPTSLKVNGKSVGTGAGASYEVIDKNTVKVLKHINWKQDKLDDYLNVDIKISEMFGKSGDWDVSFALDTKEVEKNTYVEKLDKVINANSINYNLKDVMITPLTTSINYDYVFRTSEEIENSISKELGFIMFDEKENEVKWNGGSLSGTGNEFIGQWIYINNENIEKLDIIPWYYKKSREAQEKLPATKINIEEFYPINLKVNENLSMDINDIIVDGEYLVVRYSNRYVDRKITYMNLGQIYINADGEEVSGQQNYTDEDIEKTKELYSKYNEKDKDNLVTIVKIGDSKDIEIGAYDGSSIEILKDQAFTVTKK